MTGRRLLRQEHRPPVHAATRTRTDDIVVHVEEDALILLHEVQLRLAIAAPRLPKTPNAGGLGAGTHRTHAAFYLARMLFTIRPRPAFSRKRL